MSAYFYENSLLFERLKATKERLPNHSTEQLVSALDAMLKNAIEAMVRSSAYLDDSLATILSWHYGAQNNKICVFQREDAMLHLAVFLSCESVTEKLSIYGMLHLDRMIPIGILSRWLDMAKGYRELSLKTDALSVARRIALEKDLRHDPGSHSDLFSAIASASFWLRQALSLRERIIEKYVRLVLKEATTFYKIVKFSIPLDEIIMQMLIEAIKGIDKCNPEKGAMTSYLQRWVRFSRSKIQGELETAYTVPTRDRDGTFDYKAVDLSSLDDTLGNDPTLSYITSLHVQKIARLADPEGLGRHSLGIKEYAPSI